MATYRQMMQEAIMRGQYDAAQGKPCRPPYFFRAPNALYKAGYDSEIAAGGFGTGWGGEVVDAEATDVPDEKPAGSMTREEYQDKIDKKRCGW